MKTFYWFISNKGNYMIANEHFEKSEGHWYNRSQMNFWAKVNGVTLKKLPSIYWDRLHFKGVTI